MNSWTKDPETWRTWRQLSGRTAHAVVCRMPAQIVGSMRYTREVRDGARIVASGGSNWLDEAMELARDALDALE